MKIIGIDFGEKRTGLSICDKKETLSYPLEVIYESNEEELIKKIIYIAVKNNVEMIVVGNPINMNGSFGTKSLYLKKFATKLKNKSKIPTVLWDERQTTLLASKYLIEAETKKTKKKEVIDKLAATIILDSFLKYKKNNLKINLI